MGRINLPHIVALYPLCLLSKRLGGKKPLCTLWRRDECLPHLAIELGHPRVTEIILTVLCPSGNI